VLKEELDRNGVRSKVRVSKAGVESGGQAFSRGALYTLLRNPIYVGEIRDQGVCHQGQHAPIVDRAMWDQVAQLLHEHSTGCGTRSSSYYRKLWIRCGDEKGGVPFRVGHANPGGSRVEGDATDVEGSSEWGWKGSRRAAF